MQHLNRLTSSELEEFLGRQRKTTRFTFIVKDENGFKNKTVLKNELESFNFIAENKKAMFTLKYANERP